MTTHFTSGVTNVGADSTLGKFKAPAPHKYHTYFNDFDTYLASDWTITTTEDGTGSATEALADGDGGLLLVTNAAGDNDHDFFQLVKEGYKYESGKQLAFNIRFKTNDATQTDIVAEIIVTSCGYYHIGNWGEFTARSLQELFRKLTPAAYRPITKNVKGVS